MTRSDRRDGRGGASPFANLALYPGRDLVGQGGPLAPAHVLDAYRHGVFPWFGEDDPVYWWCPDPRAVLPLDRVHVPRRLGRTLATGRFEITHNTAFDEVLAGCAANRDGTWIDDRMAACYQQLHRMGVAHSLEVRRAGRLVGGIYGVAFGAGFAGESMFHLERDASKVALVALTQHLHTNGFRLFDVQFTTEHLLQFGAVEIPRAEYLAQVRAVRDEAVCF